MFVVVAVRGEPQVASFSFFMFDRLTVEQNWAEVNRGEILVFSFMLPEMVRR